MVRGFLGLWDNPVDDPIPWANDKAKAKAEAKAGVQKLRADDLEKSIEAIDTVIGSYEEDRGSSKFRQH